ncbi:extracellular matrix/biofilm biosynthesis regulator RemA family protein [Desulfotalea psychrophila]|nr:extracellular matrix/biofilm biosynthesis regulator RemA family protein [Desulfotalea psychrophila]
MQLLNVGFGNTVMVGRVVAVVNTGSSPARKIREIAKKNGKLIDVTEGRRTRSMLVMDSNHVVLSSVQSDTISQRLQAMRIDLQLGECREQGKKVYNENE